MERGLSQNVGTFCGSPFSERARSVPERVDERSMNWYSELYIGEGAKPKAKKIIRKLKRNAGQIDIYLITLAANGQDMLDIIDSAYLKQPAVRRNLPMIVGIAKGYEEAVSLVRQMLEETYEQTGEYRIPEYLAEKAGMNIKERQWQE